MLKVLILYTSKPSVLSFLPRLEDILMEKGLTYESFAIDPHLDSFEKQKEEITTYLSSIDFAICLGGDGTVLAAASIIHNFPIPLLPVNFGQLGFIAEEINSGNLSEILDEILNKTILEEKRTLLQVSKDGVNWEDSLTALNEVYIGSNNFHRVANFAITVENQELSQYKADGILVSTATGSTGYNLSAGGPILYPSLDALVLNSVVPHRITHRPLVFPSHFRVSIRITNEFSQSLILDGQHRGHIHPDKPIYIQKSSHMLTLYYSCKRNYFESLKTKLRWMT